MPPPFRRLLPATAVVMGQQLVLDVGPRHAPGQLQGVSFAPSSDAAGELDVSAGWDDERLVAGRVERVLGRIEVHAPGRRALVTRWSAISPGIAAANGNAVRGGPYGGSAELEQNLIWRPELSSSRYRTAVPRLIPARSLRGLRTPGRPATAS
jgi:phytoene dehydrogenase-like protein